MSLKPHALHHIRIITMFHAFRYVFTLLLCCVLVGLDWAEPMMHLNLHVICSCIFMHTYLHFLLFLYILCWYFSDCFSLSLSLHSCVSLLLWHLNANLLRLGHLLPLTLHHPLFGFVMRTLERTSWRTFVNETFIQNVMSFC